MSYPVLFLRIKAMLLDSVIFALLLFIVIYLSLKLDITDPIIKNSFIAIPLILFEPTMIWLTGGSIGHHYSGNRVIGKNSGKNLFLLNGILRFILKSLLGMFSLIAMLFTKKHQSIHDYFSNSVVVFQNENIASPSHKMKEQEAVFTQKKPSIGRRLVVSISFSILATLFYSLILSLFVSGRCIDFGQCRSSEDTVLSVFGLFFMLTIVTLIYLGFICKLPGAYYRLPEVPNMQHKADV